MIQAQIICDSISPNDIRLTTFQLRYPKFIHSEFMTHRVFSRNASSSRAIPTAKYLEEVRSDDQRASPVFWGKNQPGMQAAEELPDIREDPIRYEGKSRQAAENYWINAARHAADFAERMAATGAHKQIVNRILDPFVHINVVCTATEYMNFFGLRLDKGAQPEMRALAEAMWQAYRESHPIAIEAGEWHLPYIWEKHNLDWTSEETTHAAIKVSVARCARVSYLSFESGKRSTIDEDLALYDRLVGAQPIHASPAEHQATPDELISINPLYGWWTCPEQHGNFIGWRQYRKMLPNEAVAPLPEGYAK